MLIIKTTTSLTNSFIITTTTLLSTESNTLRRKTTYPINAVGGNIEWMIDGITGDGCLRRRKVTLSSLSSGAFIEK
jgi:hypothetical protein